MINDMHRLADGIMLGGNFTRLVAAFHWLSIGWITKPLSGGTDPRISLPHEARARNERLASMLATFEPVSVPFMRLEIAKITDGRCEAFALSKVTGRVSVPLHSVLLQRKINHRAKKQSRGEGIFGSKRVGRWR